jgi:Zn finger protein HypA/HybF involved in hydrogenase expression
MSLWSWFSRRARGLAKSASSRGAPKNPIPLPSEPYVFECGQCGKVFEARRRHPLCPECDSSDVELVSD